MSLVHQILWSFGAAVWGLLMEMSPYLLLGFLMAGILHAFIPSSLIARYMGGESIWSVIRGALVGVPLPLCSCGVLPVAASARQAGAGKGPTLAFLISTPVTGIDSILATAGVLGIVFTVARVIASFIMGIAAGAASILFPGPVAPALPAEDCACDSYERPERGAASPGAGGKLKRALVYGFSELPETLVNSMAVGLLVGGVIAALVPERAITGYPGSSAVNILIAVLIGIPLYVCATGSIPIAAAMMMKGFSPGAALAFLIAGPATNAIAIATVRKILGTRHLVIYLLTIFVGAIAFAFLFDLLPFSFAMSEAMHSHSMAPHSLFYHVSAYLLIFILAMAKVKTGVRSRKFKEAQKMAGEKQILLKVPDMTCAHCERAISDKLKTLDAVKAVSVDLKNKKVAIETAGAVDPQKILDTVKALGYSPELIEQR
jgi:hypothetical protein